MRNDVHIWNCGARQLRKCSIAFVFRLFVHCLHPCIYALSMLMRSCQFRSIYNNSRTSAMQKEIALSCQCNGDDFFPFNFHLQYYQFGWWPHKCSQNAYRNDFALSCVCHFLERCQLVIIKCQTAVLLNAICVPHAIFKYYSILSTTLSSCRNQKIPTISTMVCWECKIVSGIFSVSITHIHTYKYTHPFGEICYMGYLIFYICSVQR